jgi:predicted DNA-binding transcriptional regulator AlpA
MERVSEPTGAAPPAVHRALQYVPDDPLLTAREAAAERRQGLSTFWRDVRAGVVPAAYYVGPKSPRWRRSELRAALVAARAKSVP